MYIILIRKESGMRIRVSLFLEKSQLEKLRAISRETGAPASELIRRAIDTYLKAMKKGGRK